ncbi:hypothetical protein [Escherichia coli]|uniref:hypothetical protein n=1 Tax=Escherichia coli TaxID=562 RepID=UPI000BE93CD1|nr:hypothetical protein [Escherichia coli]EFJ2312701.1 hypothetical protein [Escherichia coli]EIJ8835619.1 hypothetical protein [Escherichia coli]MBH5122152.1 hypothetical protein [Escherichia coli]NYP89600.1 hypothetical protein [Escherichia coli]NYP94660.1 hypothetical protein [Escherichia coli]
MTTITKERLLTIKQWRETYGPGSNVVLPAEEAEELARIALASLEQNALSGNSRLIPGEVLSAIREVAKIRADFDDFDGDRRGIGDCLDDAEQELIVTINKYASQLAAEPIATNDVREQTAVPPVPVTPDGWVMVPKELTPEMMRAVQIRSELGGYATSNLSGAYNMFSEFWNVAVSAAPKVDDL